MPTLRPVRPAASLRIAYERRLLALVDEMNASVIYWLKARYRQAEPEMTIYAADASPARAMQSAINRLRKRWLGRFDELADDLGGYFAKSVRDRCDKSMMDDFRKAGFTVRFKMSRAMNDAFQAVRAENVGLIKSIAQQHLASVETAVMQSVSAGRDLGTLTKVLQERHGVTRRRAALIARHQNNLATATMTRARHLELGITKAKWLHSAGGRTPRKEHIDFTGQIYDIATGHDFGNGEGRVLPGTLINCRCVSVPIVPGFDD